MTFKVWGNVYTEQGYASGDRVEVVVDADSVDDALKKARGAYGNQLVVGKPHFDTVQPAYDRRMFK